MDVNFYGASTALLCPAALIRSVGASWHFPAWAQGAPSVQSPYIASSLPSRFFDTLRIELRRTGECDIICPYWVVTVSTSAMDKDGTPEAPDGHLLKI